LIADYGVPFLVVVWTVLSFSVPRKIPSEIPRRLVAPLAWESASLYHWTVIRVIYFDLNSLGCLLKNKARRCKLILHSQPIITCQHVKQLYKYFFFQFFY